MLPRTTFSVVFFCKKTKVTKKGKAPIYARITTTGQSTEIYTQCQIEPERWNQRLERSLYKDEVDQQINRIIASYRASILAAYDRLIQENRTPTCFAVKQLLCSASSSRMLLAEFGKYCEKRQQEVGTRITQLTANKYHRLLRYMTEYIRDIYHKEDLSLETVDYAYVDGLNTYMQTAYNCHNNGAVNLLCCLKNFLLYAVRNEWIEKNPFRYYKMKIDKTNVKVPLTKAELDLLLRRPMPNERLDRIRDVFCFCALTGLAFTDVDHLRQEHFTTDEEGQLWIHKPREKTSVMSRVPVLPQAAALLEKYRDDANCRARGKLLPVPSNTKMNAYLKEIADICQIHKHLTTHHTGHTFKASQVDRKFSYGRLMQRIEQNRLRQAMIERVRNYTDEQRPQVAAILQKLEAEKQRQRQPEQSRRNLSIAGRPLTKEQIEMLREGEPIFVRGTQSEGYVVMDDRLQMAWVYQSDPRDWVEYGKYTMRRMDRDRIEAGYVVRALVKWWGGTTARPYLWKENASDTTYRESWDDPREPRPAQTERQQDRPRRFIIPKKKSRGPSR